ncbi:MAG: putative 5-formyltetrahydrofolate cyclo-ligase [Parachlamydiales bacterium]|nr:putative 5-formyltetrahydrofolate cyclo-ligase [Parachlamydiales bacterium]
MKAELRKTFLFRRNSLSLERRQEAALGLAQRIDLLKKYFDRIASFHSMKYEINLTLINQSLAAENRLLLPRRTSDSHLQYYLVSNLTNQMEKCGQLWEPDPTRCSAATLTKNDCLLIPGLAFDQNNDRLGLGGGFFDRFLFRHPGLYAVGIGFFEQRSIEPLPRDPWDQSLSDVFYF